MSALRLYLFGAPRLESDGKSLAVSRRKGLAMLAYLALRGQPQSREALATLFWPDYDQSGALSNLRRELSRLRTGLDVELVVADRRQVELAPESNLWIDVRQYQRLLAQAAAHGDHFPAEPCPNCRAALQEAVGLQTERFLAGFNLPDCPEFDDWQFFEAEGLSQSLAEALQKLIQGQMQAGEHDEAIRHARRWLALDSLHEPAHRQLMTIYAQAGQQAAALRQYEECARILEEELGIEPEQETLQLYEAIRLRRFPLERPQPPAVHELQQVIRFCRSADGVQIAYATVGEGPPLVKAANYLTHLEHDWNGPVWRHWLRALASRHTLVRYDERGSGLSDWDVTNFTMDAWVRDLEAVVDALGLQRFPLLGISQGASVSVAYAVKHPERVSHLILYGGYARGRFHRDPVAEHRLQGETMVNAIRVGWGKENPAFRQLFTTLLMPGGNEVQKEWLNELARISATPENAATMEHAFYQIEVSEQARQVTTPTLVLHGRNDEAIPFAEGRLLASLIPGARFVSLESDNHILLEHEPAWRQFLAALYDFLETPGAPAAPQAWPDVSLPAAPAVERAAHEPPAEEPQRAETALKMAASDLPAQTTPFVGRERELQELRQMLWQQPPVRLVTLVGPGGIGKTRLATETAAASAAHFGDGLLFVSLASLTAAEQIVPAIVQALRVQFREAGDERDQLLRYLGTRRQLLVLDNFEHLLDGVFLVKELLARTTDVTLLVTSREPLNLSGETVYRLSGLPYPEGALAEGARPSDYEAVALLQQQIARNRPGFKPDAAELQQMARICRLVQGMPLALVLAANWIELLSLEEIADEIADCLDLLEGELRDLPARQQSIRAVFHSSWRLLDEEAQAAMARLSIFRGPFSRPAAQAVGRCSLRILLALVNKSWLQRGHDGFQIHELVRQFAAEQLRELPGGEGEARDDHAAYYAAFLGEQDGLMTGPRQKEAFQAVGGVFDQAAAAWRWLVERDSAGDGAQTGLRVIVEQMLPALYRYVESLQRGGDLVKLLEMALAAPAGDPALRAILLAAKTAFYRTGLPIRFEAVGVVMPIDDQLQQAWELAEQQPLPAFWCIVLWYGYGRNFARDEAIARMRPLLERLRAEDARWELAFGLHHLVQLIQLWPEDEVNRTEAPAYLAEALQLMQELGDGRERGFVLRSLGQMHRLREELPQAIRHWQEAGKWLDEAGEWIIATLLHWHIGDAYLQMGDLDGAFAHYRTMSEAALSREPRALVGDMIGKESFETARYGRLERALETKWAALAYARAAGDQFTEAWTTWEMGELCRLCGELDEAVVWYERSLPLFQHFDDKTGYAFYHRGLADVAAARGFYAVALVNFEESLRHAREHNHSWAQAYALIGLGRANLALGELPLAQEQMARAVATARSTGDRAITLAALSGAAELLARSGRAGRALELAVFVADHPIAWTEIRARAEALRASLALPEAERAEAERRARAQEIWSLADEMSRELATNRDGGRGQARAADGPASPPI